MQFGQEQFRQKGAWKKFYHGRGSHLSDMLLHKTSYKARPDRGAEHHKNSKAWKTALGGASPAQLRRVT